MPEKVCPHCNVKLDKYEVKHKIVYFCPVDGCGYSVVVTKGKGNE